MLNIEKGYFGDLFTSKGRGSKLEHILFGVDCCVTKEANVMLLVKYTK